MNSNLFLIFIIITIVACETREKMPESVKTGNQFTLEQFIMNTNGSTDSMRVVGLLQLLNSTKKDSAVYRDAVSYLTAGLSNPNSIYRNEKLYLTLLNEQLLSKWYNVAEKEQLLRKRKLLQQNRVGDFANDFSYYTPEGKEKRMYDVEAEYLIMLFYNPECDACKGMKETLRKSEIINRKAKVIAIYTDKDEAIWRKHLPYMPTNWVHGKDEDEYLWKNKIYDLRAIPTVYLLNKEKKVLLKDCMEVSKIEEVLMGDE